MDVFSQSTTRTTTTAGASKGDKHKRSNYSKLNHLLATLVAWTTLLVLTSIYYYFCLSEFASQFGVAGVAFIGFDIVLWLWTLGAMTLTTVMDPGIMPKATNAEELFWLRVSTPNVNRKLGMVAYEVNGKNIFVKWCRTCHMFRPPRSSHCGVCDRCIETFDHHCPWVNNCIGKRNYKPYVLLLLGANIHVIDIFVLSLSYIIKNVNEISNTTSVVHIICIVYVVAGLISFMVVSNLTLLHLKLVTKCLTTKEYNTYLYSKIGGNPLKRTRFRNWFTALCSPQYPSYQPATTLYVKVPDTVKINNETKSVAIFQAGVAKSLAGNRGGGSVAQSALWLAGEEQA